MNYREYSFSALELVTMGIKSVGITFVISWLFYNSLWGMVLTPVILLVIRKRTKRDLMEKRQRALWTQFMDGLKVVTTCVMSGMSMENGWKECAKEMKILHGEESLFYIELTQMNHYIAGKEPMEKVLLDFAYRSGIEDLISFAEGFAYGKRSGANWRKLIQETAYRMEEKYETEKEIQVLLAEKRMELKIMSMIPLGMIAFLRFSSGEYMDVLYQNPLGICCMTLCLGGYGLALYLGEKIMRIQV